MAALDFSRRRRRWILLLAAVGFSGYGLYKLHHHPFVSAKRKKLSRIAGTLISVSDAVASSAETFSLVSSDISRFLRSDTNEIPTSLKQLSKIARSNEFSASISRVSEALTLGISRGCASVSAGSGISSAGFSDRLLDKLFSPAGSGFVSAVAGSFARNLVMAFYPKGLGGTHGEFDSSEVPWWIPLICRDECREIVRDCIDRFVTTAVTVYLDKTLDINPYDQIFDGLTNPKHETKMKEIMVLVCNGAMETLIKTSHQVLSNSNLGSSSNRDGELSLEGDRRGSYGADAKEGNGWIDQVSSALAVPSNRKFVLDLTGRVTFETVRSFIDYLLRNLINAVRRSVSGAYEEIVERGSEVLRYITAKSMFAVTLSIALCMRVLTGMRVLTPA